MILCLYLHLSIQNISKWQSQKAQFRDCHKQYFQSLTPIINLRFQMSDEDWGLEQDTSKKEVDKTNQLATPELPKEQQKEEGKKEEEGSAELDQSQSWIPDKKPEARGRSRARGEENVATVQEKAEELKPDANDDSVWGQSKVQKQEEENVIQRSGRGRGNRQGQEENGERGARGGYNRNYQNNQSGRGNREQENGQRGRGNRNGDGPERGNRNGNGQSYPFRADGRERENRRNWQDRGERSDRGGYGRGRGRGNYHNDRNFQNSGNSNQAAQAKPQQVAKTNTAPLPKGRKCWPQSSIYIFGVKLTVTFRRIQDFKCKVLVVPFKTPKLELYPGNIVNQSKVNYKDRIAKKEDLRSAGDTYFQKAHEIATFEALAFVKIDESQIQESIKKGVKQVFERIESINEANLQSVVFCVSEELGNPLPVIHESIQCLQQTQKVKEFFISTVSPKCFLSCLAAFHQEVETLFDENQISME